MSKGCDTEGEAPPTVGSLHRPGLTPAVLEELIIIIILPEYNPAGDLATLTILIG
jgi:hypothetical protein